MGADEGKFGVGPFVCRISFEPKGRNLHLNLRTGLDNAAARFRETSQSLG
jgi:hypothetical protein